MRPVPRLPGEDRLNSAQTPQATEAAPAATTARPDSLPAVLCVDDDAAVLRSAQRVLARRFRVVTALGPVEALNVARAAEEPFAVVVSDLRMPGLSGIGLLQCFRQLAPQTVRVLLSGNADLDDAVAAVNAGEIFRFLRKPYEPEALISTVSEACEHHRALASGVAAVAPAVAPEHRSDGTAGLAGHVATLSALLAAFRPDAAECAARVARCVTELTTIATVACAEALGTAAALSQLGCARLPAAVADRIYGGALLSTADRAAADRIPIMSADILAGAPGFEQVCALLTAAVGGMCDSAPGGPATHAADAREAGADDVALGARLLAAALRRDRYARQGILPSMPLFDATGLGTGIAERINAVLGHDDAGARIRTIRMGELRPGMVLAEDVPSPRGLLLAASGHVVTDLLVAHIRNAWDSALIVNPVRVHTRHPSADSNAPDGA